MADVGGMTKVTGRRIAVPFVGPKPGIHPKTVPKVTPITIQKILYGVNAIANPPIKRLNISSIESSFLILKLEYSYPYNGIYLYQSSSNISIPLGSGIFSIYSNINQIPTGTMILTIAV